MDKGLEDAVAVARRLVAGLADSVSATNRDDPAAAALRDAHAALARIAGEGGNASAAPTAALLAFDVSDLLGYFKENRLPTGIQRVQAELIVNILTSGRIEGVQLCSFAEKRQQWVKVDSPGFIDLCVQSRSGGDASDPDWRSAVDKMNAVIAGGDPLVMQQGGTLVNLGSSWWLPDYFRYVRELKITYGIRYIPLIYDLIPALAPRYCDDKLVVEFINWSVGVLAHADFFLAISEATKRDLLAYGERLGRTIDPAHVSVIRLDADFRSTVDAIVDSAGSIADPFVLFVSTIEARKNQLGALDAWTALIARHGAKKVPRLVLVGKLGFGSDKVLARLESSADLRERVTMLSGVNDAQLQSLYRDCLFTIYPSFYEGWGLPVTESLCYGKVPVTADNSSLPEAGTDFAVYFRTGSTTALVSAVEQIAFDPAARERHQQKIAAGFRPRLWKDLADEALRHLNGWIANAHPMAWRTPLARSGCYYSLARDRSTRLWRGRRSAEIFRRGPGWHQVEDFGVWTRPEGAELGLTLDGKAARIGIELNVSPRVEADYHLQLAGHGVRLTGRIDGSHPSKWVFLDIPESARAGEATILLATTIVSQPPLGWNGDFRPLGVGVKSFFVFSSDATSRIDFVEAAALGALSDYDGFGDHAPEPVPTDEAIA